MYQVPHLKYSLQSTAVQQQLHVLNLSYTTIRSTVLAFLVLCSSVDIMQGYYDSHGMTLVWLQFFPGNSTQVQRYCEECTV